VVGKNALVRLTTPTGSLYIGGTVASDGYVVAVFIRDPAG